MGEQKSCRRVDRSVVGEIDEEWRPTQDEGIVTDKKTENGEEGVES